MARSFLAENDGGDYFLELDVADSLVFWTETLSKIQVGYKVIFLWDFASLIDNLVLSEINME